MNQSTIYRRHEARLSRTHALKDDPRPAAVRVLSLLPLFRMIVPSYQPSVTVKPLGNTSKIVDVPAFSQDTVFSTHELSTAPSPSRLQKESTSSSLTTTSLIGGAAIGACMLFVGSKRCSFSPRYAYKGGISPFAAVHGGGSGLLLGGLRYYSHNLPKGIAAAAAATTLLAMASLNTSSGGDSSSK